MIERVPGEGWLALVGGGELTFGETEMADRAWLAKTGEGAVGFIPAASGSTDYGEHFTIYLDEYFERKTEVIPVYRLRDAKRGKNGERIAAAPALYLGGGVVDYLLEAFPKDTPAREALDGRLSRPGVTAAIASAAEACGAKARSLFGKKILDGLGWLPHTVVEPNFDPGHDHRLRKMMRQSGARQGLAIAATSAVLLGPSGECEVHGDAWTLADPDGKLERLSSSH